MPYQEKLTHGLWVIQKQRRPSVQHRAKFCDKVTPSALPEVVEFETFLQQTGGRQGAGMIMTTRTCEDENQDIKGNQRSWEKFWSTFPEEHRMKFNSMRNGTENFWP